MPKIEKSYIGCRGGLAVMVAISACLYLISPWLIGLVPIFVIVTAYDWKRQERYFQEILKDRNGESICQFARSFQKVQIDPWVIRAVYEELQEYVGGKNISIPIRANDQLIDDLKIDHEDFDSEIVQDISTRCGRALDGYEQNVHYKNIYTVKDLVLFLNEQPRTLWLWKASGTKTQPKKRKNVLLK